MNQDLAAAARKAYATQPTAESESINHVIIAEINRRNSQPILESIHFEPDQLLSFN